MSTATISLANQEFQVGDRYRLQQILPKLGTKFGGGKDIRSVLVNRKGQGKRHHNNRL